MPATAKRRSAAQAGETDHAFLLALGLSLAGHAVLLGTQMMTAGRIWFSSSTNPTKLVYEHETPREQGAWSRSAGRIQVAPLPGPAHVPAPEALSGGLSQGTVAWGIVDAAAHSAVADGPGQGWASVELPTGGAWSAAIDLTNLTAAAHGDPVLYSYFSAMRERIQHTANARSWLPKDESGAGTVSVGFVVDRAGAIQTATVLVDRSVSSAALQETALRLVKASGPFLPFPPSFEQSALAIVVPIEFSFGGP